MSIDTMVYTITDDPETRRALQIAIEDHGHTVQSFDCAREFLDDYKPGQTACLILDVPPSGVSSVRLQATLTAMAAETPVILLTDIASIHERIDTITAGAIDFVEKPYRDATLLDHVDCAFARLQQREHERVARIQALKRFGRLRRRERQVLALMVESTGALSSRQIAAQMNISPRTVEHYRASLLNTMQAESVTQLILQGILCGLPFVGGHPGSASSVRPPAPGNGSEQDSTTTAMRRRAPEAVSSNGATIRG